MPNRKNAYPATVREKKVNSNIWFKYGNSTWGVRIAASLVAAFLVLALRSGWIASGTGAAWTATVQQHALLDEQYHQHQVLIDEQYRVRTNSRGDAPSSQQGRLSDFAARDVSQFYSRPLCNRIGRISPGMSRGWSYMRYSTVITSVNVAAARDFHERTSNCRPVDGLSPDTKLKVEQFLERMAQRDAQSDSSVNSQATIKESP